MKNLKVTISVSLDEDTIEQVKLLKGHPLLESASEVHLVHVFNIRNQAYELVAYTFPSQEQFPEIEKTIVEILDNIKKELFPDQARQKNCHSHCFFHASPKERLCSFLADSKSDVVVSATRGKHGVEGLFYSSFTDYLLKFSPCDVFAVRPR